MISLVERGYLFLKENDLRSIAAWVTSKEAPPLVQFAKYGVCGVLATAVQVGLFYCFALTIFPQALDHQNASLAARGNHAIYANLAAFPFSNTLAYLTNVLWVFTTGRHNKTKEFFFFTIVSAVSFSVGLVAGPQLIKWFAVSTHLAEAGFVISSALVNFIIRKSFVFLK